MPFIVNRWLLKEVLLACRPPHAAIRFEERVRFLKAAVPAGTIAVADESFKCDGVADVGQMGDTQPLLLAYR